MPSVRVVDASRRALGRVTDRAVARLRPLVTTQSRLYPVLHAVRHRLPTAPPSDPLSDLVAEFARAFPSPFFVQVGANDGNKGDYLEGFVESRGWRGVLVEPIPYVFAKLERRHGRNDRLTLVNAAISDRDGSAEIYYLPQDDGSGLPVWYDALATFRREVIAKHAQWIPDIDSRIATIEVPTLTFDSLCERHGIHRIDLVQVDTEGFDYQVVKQIDLDRYRPTLVMYEHYHLQPGEREACERFLEMHGYLTISNFMDTVAVRDDVSDKRIRRLTALLKRLRNNVVGPG